MEPVYYNFDLAIDKTDEGYLTRLVEAPDGAGSARFILPLSEQDLDQLWSTVERRRELDPSEQRRIARMMGERLFGALFAGEVGAAYRNSMRSAYQSRTSLCVRLDLSQAPRLSHLPWEFLFDSQTNEFLTLSVHTPLVRHLDLMHQVEAIPVQPPLRVLAVVAEPDTYARFDGQRKWYDLVDSIDSLAREKRLLVEKLAKPSLFELQRRLRQDKFHVLHFIGHGIDNPLTEDGQLVFEDEIRRGRTVSGLHLGTLLRDHYPLRLAILQSCDDFADGIRHNPFAQVAQNMVLRQVPAAIALPQSLAREETMHFLHALYGGLAGYRPIAAAVTDARNALYRFNQGIEWGLPLLYSRAPNGYLFDDGSLVRPAAVTTQREPSLWERVMQMGRNRPDPPRDQ
jgi:hypothetical protein